MAPTTQHAIIQGRVQGVYFREYTRREADRLGLGGWVRNLPDGTVEAVVTGKKEKVDQMIDWLHTGSPMAVVTEVLVKEHEAEETFTNFTIRQ